MKTSLGMIALAVAATALGGCSAFHIYDSQSVEQKGVLINVKKPVTMHTTQWSVTRLSVQVEVITPGSTPDKDKVDSIPESPIVVTSTPATRDAVDGLARYIANVEATQPLGEFYAGVRKHLAALTDAAINDAKAGSNIGVLASNTRTVEAILAPEQYYYNAKVPLFGSINTSVKLASDGTLTEATANITDKTAETLLSMFPAKELLTKQLLPEKTKFEAAARKVIIKLRVGDDTAIVTLKKPIGEGYCASDGSLKPLSIADGQLGQNCVQLVSIASTGAGGGDKNTPSKKAYEITGRIVPPQEK